MLKPPVIILLLVMSASNLTGQERVYRTADDIQRDVTLLLLNKNINEVTKELDSESASTVPSLLRRLVIYSRAGQLQRVNKTLQEMSVNSNWQCPSGYDFRWLIKQAGGNSLDAQRFYYERLCPDDTEGAEEFVRSWVSQGDYKEIDAWLNAHSTRNDAWLMLRVQLRARQGTANEVLDTLAADLKANPADWPRLGRYLQANNYANNLQDVSWVADSFEAHTAGDYFQLGEKLQHYSSTAAVKLFRKSLEVEFTDADAKLVDDLINRYRSFGVPIKVNREKQLRYWTKRSLAEAYRQSKQALAAQPLVEELVEMKGDDILLQDVHQLAGAVQSESGQRVVETKVLRDERARYQTAEYWLERANYYDGRHEYAQERSSYRQALTALICKPDESQKLQERLRVVRPFAFFLAESHDDKVDKVELAKLLTTELNSVEPESDYAYQIARLLVQSELELGATQEALLANRPSFLARLLNSKAEWGNEETYFIKNVVQQSEISSDTKTRIWSSLESLVREPGSSRAYQLAEAMQDCGEWHRSISLLRGYIDHDSKERWEGYSSNAVNNLFTAYCRTNQWQKAEKLLLAQGDSGWRDLAKSLAAISIVAAKQDANEDAMRLWRMSTNLDRRNLESLAELAQTNVRSQLFVLYSKMKAEDPESNIPDLALRVLQ